jgi:excisionase family DNA binding protein
MRLLTVAELALELRFSVKTARRRIHAGEIRAVREGGRWLISDVELRRYVTGLPAHVGTVPVATPSRGRALARGARLWD